MYAQLDASIAACTCSGLALVGCLRYAALFVKMLENKKDASMRILTSYFEKHGNHARKRSAR